MIEQLKQMAKDMLDTIEQMDKSKCAECKGKGLVWTDRACWDSCPTCQQKEVEPTVDCPECGGSGDPCSSNVNAVCSECNGTGEIIHGENLPIPISVECKSCKGSTLVDVIEPEQGDCPTCGGLGIQVENLSKDQAKRLLDLGWVVGKDDNPGYWFNHNNRSYYYYEKDNTVMSHDKLVAPNGYKVTGRAVEKLEGLYFDEALKLARENEGSRIRRTIWSTGYYIYYKNGQFEKTESTHINFSFWDATDWQWIKHNYPVHLIEEGAE
jgi:hypothetical protein